MYRTLLIFGAIVFANLFAFLVVGNILDAVFLTGHKFLMGSIVFSIFPLIGIMSYFVKKITKQLNTLNSNKNDGK